MTPEQVFAKATGFVRAITQMGRSERNMSPTQTYGEDYNRLREMVKEICPGQAALLPPLVTFYRDTRSANHFALARYGEILTYCEQLIGLIRNEHPQVG